VRSSNVLRLLGLGTSLTLTLWATACTATDDDDSTPPPCENDGVPELIVQGIDDGQPVGFAAPVLVQTSDGDGVRSVTVWYRTVGVGEFVSSFLSNAETGQDDIYAGEIPPSVVQDPGVEWYVVVADAAEGCSEEVRFPEDAPDTTLTFTTLLDLQPLPYLTDFETGDPDCGDNGVDQVGWTNVIGAFPQEIHSWQLEGVGPLSGDCSATHSEGIPGGLWECPPPDGTGTINRQNWLISPPIDLRDKSRISARWFERHLVSGICAEAHALYISTGSPNPDGGDYELVADVPIGGSAWGPSDWYDLSAWAGSEAAYLALYYEGGAAGRWQIDDFYVGEPLADLVLEAAGPLGDDVAPGSEGVELSVTIRNDSSEFTSDELTATLVTADEDLTIVTGTATLAALGPAQSGPVSPAFVFDVEASHPDNAWLDFAVQLDDGAGHAWTVPVRLLMGEPSTVVVDYTVTGLAQLQLELGHGFPVAPNFAIAESTMTLAGAPWTFDATEEAAVLPPGPGVRRWFLRATNNSPSTGFVDAVTFTVGGVEYTAAIDALTPLEVTPGASVIVRVPEPPALVVESYTTAPDPVGPGDSVALQDLVLRNDGNDTAGPVQCVLDSGDPDASGFDGTPVAFGPDVLVRDASATAEADFSFDVAAAHNDDSSLPLTLLCIDGADTLPVEFDLPVPYAHPVFESFTITDDCAACDEDGLLDGGEQVDVRLVARNDGSLPTDGPLTATLTVGQGSTASFTIANNVTLTFGVDALEAGASLQSDNVFEVSMDPGALLGDSIVLDVQWAAGSDTWTETILLEAVGLPWLPCPEAADPMGDAVGGSDIDIAGCDYRSDRTLLQVRVNSYTPFVGSSAFIDFFFFEVPQMYSLESVSGSANLEEDCIFGDDVPAEQITVPLQVDVGVGTTYSATARLAIADLSFLANNTQVAFGAGSCPGPFFCDVYPDSAFNIDLLADPVQFACDGNDFIPINW